MTALWPVVVIMAIAIVMFVRERRHTMRERHERVMQVYGWRRGDRDRAVKFGKDMFASSGDPYLDPDAYDSEWEYAEGVREHLDLPQICDIETGRRTATDSGGVRHRIAVLCIEDLRIATLLCNPDVLQTRTDPAGHAVTCLLCIMKEHDGT
jgi:hypothetical protein